MMLAREQVKAILSHPALPWYKQFSVLVADSSYSAVGFLGRQVQHENLVTVVRVRSNRVFYQTPTTAESPLSRGRPRWYGERFDLKDETSWHHPDETEQITITTCRGRLLTVTVRAWHQMLMRGTRDYPMHLHPFTLLQIQVTDADGQLIFRPMWLLVIGQRRAELSLLSCYHAYRQRFNLEHFLRFSKQRLLMTAYSTPDVQNEENWVQLVLLAYVQLWAARELAMHLPRSWERYLKRSLPPNITPSLVQRDFARIVAVIGTPAAAPKRRGKSPGRAQGNSLGKRQRHPVIKKGKTATSKIPNAA